MPQNNEVYCSSYVEHHLMFEAVTICSRAVWLFPAQLAQMRKALNGTFINNSLYMFHNSLVDYTNLSQF